MFNKIYFHLKKTSFAFHFEITDRGKKIVTKIILATIKVEGNIIHFKKHFRLVDAKKHKTTSIAQH